MLKGPVERPARLALHRIVVLPYQPVHIPLAAARASLPRADLILIRGDGHRAASEAAKSPRSVLTNRLSAPFPLISRMMAA